MNRFRDPAACSGATRTALPSSLRGADKMQEPGPGTVGSLCPWAPPHAIITNEPGHTVRGKLMTFVNIYALNELIEMISKLGTPLTA